MIERIDSKSISVCLINDYLLIADLHIFASISLECTKVKLLILNIFDMSKQKCWLLNKNANKKISYKKEKFNFPKVLNSPKV